MKDSAHKEIPARLERVERALSACSLCPRKCGVNRLKGRRGYCGIDAGARCFREMIGYNEERELTPSHQLYFAGCNLRCRYCTVAEWNRRPAAAPAIADARLVRTIARRRRQGACALNVLGGEPSVSLYGILRLLARVPSSVRVAWNSNLYFSPLVAEMLDGLAEVYIADFKCGNNACATHLLGTRGDYVDVIRRNLLAVRKTARVIVRHLVIPGHFACCVQPMLRWLAREMPDTPVSLRGNYVPPADDPVAPRRFLEPIELERTLRVARSLGLEVVE